MRVEANRQRSFYPNPIHPAIPTSPITIHIMQIICCLLFRLLSHGVHVDSTLQIWW